jgi:hypothetical protein
MLRLKPQPRPSRLKRATDVPAGLDHRPGAAGSKRQASVIGRYVAEVLGSTSSGQDFSRNRNGGKNPGFGLRTTGTALHEGAKTMKGIGPCLQAPGFERQASDYRCGSSPNREGHKGHWSLKMFLRETPCLWLRDEPFVGIANYRVVCRRPSARNAAAAAAYSGRRSRRVIESPNSFLIVSGCIPMKVTAGTG